MKVTFYAITFFSLLIKLSIICQETLNLIQPSELPNSDRILQTISQTNSIGCIEADPASLCIQKPTCCHVTSGYNSYLYSGCVNAFDSRNFPQFCYNFYKLNRQKNYFPSECICNGGYLFNNTNYLKLTNSYVISLIILLFVLLF